MTNPKFFQLSMLIACAFALIATNDRAALAQTPDAPVILDAGPGGCVPSDEICGDGIDQDCNGSDAPCPGGDADRDGFATAQDCDDNNRNVYPGISVACSASCGPGTQTCQDSGSFSGCSCAPLCEATGGGRCFYISKLTGNDSAPGSFAQPLKTPTRLLSMYSGGSPIRLGAGDVVYFMSGLYDETHAYSNRQVVLPLQRINGTANAPITLKAYPGAHPVIAPNRQAEGVFLYKSSHVHFEGFEFVRTYGTGLRIDESDGIELRNLWVHDTDGLDNNNIAGVYITRSTNSSVHHSLVHDNYDRSASDTGGQKTVNSRNMVFFQGGNIHIHHNVIFQSQATTAPLTGSCITYKHTATLEDSVWEVNNNVFWNCFEHAIGGGTFNSHIHHNLILNSNHAIAFEEIGGPNILRNNIVEKNTIVGGVALKLFASRTSDDQVGLHAFRNNIVVDPSRYGLDVGGILNIDNYGDDDTYRKLVEAGNLQADSNCYQSTRGAVQFGLFANNASANRSLGGLYSFSQWQSLGYDGNSFEGDPQLDASFSPQRAECRERGHYAP